MNAAFAELKRPWPQTDGKALKPLLYEKKE